MASSELSAPGSAPTPLSAQNPRVKEARKLARRAFRSETGRFLVDGPKAVEGALKLSDCLIEVFVTETALAEYADLVQALPSDVGVRLVAPRAMELLSDSVSPAGIVGVGRTLDVPLPDLLTQAPELLTICSDIRDPGNAGTVIRTSDAAGADGVVLAGHSVDLYNAKTVRASVGSIFHLPIASAADAPAAVQSARVAGLVVLAADGAGEVDLFEAESSGLLALPTAWLFGNEAWGLSDELATAADHRVAIPIHGQAESLNLATAAAVCLYASARAQRSRRGPR